MYHMFSRGFGMQTRVFAFIQTDGKLKATCIMATGYGVQKWMCERSSCRTDLWLKPLFYYFVKEYLM